MSDLTNEQIEAILDGAPEGATHYAQGMHYLAYNSSGNWMRYDPSGIGGFCWFDANEFKFSYTKSFHNLSDLREILELRQDVERLKAEPFKYPMQHIAQYERGVYRFEANPIIDWLASEVSDMNQIAVWAAENNVPNKYKEQLAQLVGYSVRGYGTLSYVTDESYERANQLREQSK